ncbi:FCD domain-containing protein [Microbacterium sorbitolivorans]|uniref:FCD domain-containing protein n=1 Tax=Microbacterium sorbitolivorans TaxID=1867410 RepID=A0A367Y2Z5_9MICO|nr:FCD domain-containing protein [Microbacterium sorbitolivorans]
MGCRGVRSVASSRYVSPAGGTRIASHITCGRYGITWIHEAHEHEAILDAIESGDAERARELDENHIRSFTDHVVTRLKEHDEWRGSSRSPPRRSAKGASTTTHTGSSSTGSSTRG